MDHFFKQILLFFIIAIVLFAIYYFISVKTLKRNRKYYENLQTSLKTGDKVIILGSVYGIVQRLTKTDAYIKISDNSVIKVKREAISQKI